MATAYSFPTLPRGNLPCSMRADAAKPVALRVTRPDKYIVFQPCGVVSSFPYDIAYGWCGMCKRYVPIEEGK